MAVPGKKVMFPGLYVADFCYERRAIFPGLKIHILSHVNL